MVNKDNSQSCQLPFNVAAQRVENILELLAEIPHGEGRKAYKMPLYESYSKSMGAPNYPDEGLGPYPLQRDDDFVWWHQCVLITPVSSLHYRNVGLGRQSAWLSAAVRLLELEDLEGARQVLRQGIEKEKTEPQIELWMVLAWTFETEGNYEGQIATFEQALLKHPRCFNDSGSFWDKWLQAYEDDGKLHDAIQTFELALERGERCSTALAHAYEEHGEPRKAIAVLEKAIEDSSRNGPAEAESISNYYTAIAGIKDMSFPDFQPIEVIEAYAKGVFYTEDPRSVWFLTEQLVSVQQRQWKI